VNAEPATPTEQPSLTSFNLPFSLLSHAINDHEINIRGSKQTLDLDLLIMAENRKQKHMQILERSHPNG
jgi:autotransporter translocation and assembly factor TamB